MVHALGGSEFSLHFNSGGFISDLTLGWLQSKEYTLALKFSPLKALEALRVVRG
jgi:hypothetical protein